MNSRILFFLFLIIGLISCKSSEDNDAKTYLGALDYSNASMDLYTKNGQISDSKLINDFMRRHNGGYKLFPLLPNYSATFLNENYVILTHESAMFPTVHDTLNIIEKNGVVYWESRFNSDETESILNIFMYWPIHSTTTENGDSIFVSHFNYCYYLRRDGSDFILPMMSFFYIKDGVVIQGFERNEFDKSCLEKFGDTDTIIIHSYNLRFGTE